MKTFISFADNDVQLMCQLKRMLKNKNIEAYVFCQNKEYELGLCEKITNAIDESDALIAIITKDNNSPSVHEEIGCAIGGNKLMIMMLEHGAKDGVLSHDREQERFTKDDFETSCKNIIKYLEEVRNRLVYTEQDSDDFCVNESSKKLTNIASKYENEFPPNIHSKMLFSACPPKLLRDVPIISSKYNLWLNEQKIEINNSEIRILTGEQNFGNEKIMYYDRTEHGLFKYLEIHLNGFVEQGFTERFICRDITNFLDPRIALHSSFMAHRFWAFLTFCQMHYSYHKYKGDLDVFLSIKDANQLTFKEFEGSVQNNMKESEPEIEYMSGKMPKTNEKNLQVTERIKITDLSESQIKNLTRKFANKIANAYGLKDALCYNSDGTLSQINSSHL